MKVRDVIWINSLDENFTGNLIGIVMGEDSVTGQKKIYIGTGDGQDEKADIERICQTGGKLTQKDALMIHEHFGCWA